MFYFNGRLTSVYKVSYFAYERQPTSDASTVSLYTNDSLQAMALQSLCIARTASHINKEAFDALLLTRIDIMVNRDY